jgi:hypothetical protein
MKSSSGAARATASAHHAASSPCSQLVDWRATTRASLSLFHSKALRGRGCRDMQQDTPSAGVDAIGSHTALLHNADTLAPLQTCCD